MSRHVVVLGGDGIGPEVTGAAVEVLRELSLTIARGEFVAQRQPVRQPELAPLGAHALAQVDDVQRPVERFAIPGEGLFARPEVLRRG